jgi:HPt (histidine-containing phosphotransfer) domain-containing protein
MVAEQSPNPAGSVFDRPDLLRRLGDDVEIAREIVKVFLGDAPSQVTRLREAVARRDLGEISAAGHRIRGAAASVGCTRLRRAVEAVELAPAELGQARREALMQEVDRQYALVEVVLLEELGAAPRPGSTS